MSFQLDRGLFQFEFTDRHAILGVNVNAEELEIRNRYQEVARRLHPDSSAWETATDRNLAVQLFSRLVTHAYAKLSRPSQRQEEKLMLDLLGKRLVNEGSKIEIVDPLAQQLYQSGNDTDRVYHELLTQLVKQQYDKLDLSIQIINQISELNMVYLLRKQLQAVQSTPPTSKSTAISGVSKKDERDTQGSESGKSSLIEGSLRRAEEYINMKNWNKAVLELRDATNLEPNNSRAHALLGLAYLRQQQNTMAKISINKALQLNPKEPQAIQAKQELDKAMKTTTAASQPAAKKTNEGMFGGLFGKKK
jgi:curved DNA-binding protein CbpA